MTIEELCEWSADKLEKLTDKELYDICSQYFNVTRPDKVQATRQPSQQTIVNAEQQKKFDLIKEKLGIDLSEDMKRKRKR